jgi:hypothetical protein
VSGAARLAGGSARRWHHSPAAASPSSPWPVSRFESYVNLKLTIGKTSTYS